MRHLPGVDVGGREHAVRGAVAGRGGQAEAGIAGQRELHRDVGERAAHDRGVRVACHAAQDRACQLFGFSVGAVQPGEGPRQLGRPVGQPALELPASKLRLGLDIEPGDHEIHLVAEASERVQRDLQLRRRGLAANAAYPDPVRAVLRELDGVKPGRDVRSRVPHTLDLVHQLRGDGAGRDRPAGTGMLGDHAGAVPPDFGDREAGAGHVVKELGEERVVPAGGLGAALDDVAGRDGPGQLVVVGASPAEVRRGRADDERGVGDAAGDHDVGAGVQACDDAPRAQVGAGGQRAAEPQLGRAGGQVIAFDMSELRRDSELLRERPELAGEPGGVEAARVDDDPRLAVHGQAEALLHLTQEGLGVPGFRVLEPVAGEDEHR
jgi:hypothetical protein